MNKRLISNYEEKKGITLIALVVTIVVLLILAGVSINAIFSDSGILNRAQTAQNKMDQATENDLQGINTLNDIIRNKGNNSTGSEEQQETQTISDAVINKKMEKNTKLQDAYGNSITVPAGFKILPHNESSTTGIVTYTYSGNKISAVQDGIVIENETDGNQFVWVPVGTIKNKDNKTNTITLGRYEDFTMTNGKVAEGQPVQSAENYKQETLIRSTFKEVATADSTVKNTIARDLETFITTTLKNGGYYIARYEASGTAEKVESKYDKGQIGNLAQPAAATASREMYGVVNDEKGQLLYASDLVNSYAWDTAIIFIQTYSDNEKASSYATQNKSTGLENTGINNDRYCNIWDMSGNLHEWTTESTTNPDYEDFPPCVERGGVYGLGSGSPEEDTSYRYYESIDYFSFDGFRVLLYVSSN